MRHLLPVRFVAPTTAPTPETRATRRAHETRTARKARAPRVIGFTVAAALLAAGGLTATNPAFAATLDNAGMALSTAAQSSPTTLREITETAEATVDAARDAIAEARAVSAEVDASGLAIGVDSRIDTRELRERVTQLDAIDVIPTLLLPALSDETAAHTERVLGSVAALRVALSTAQVEAAAKAAAEQAAAQAAAEAAAAAAAQAQAEAEAAAAAARAAELAAAANTPDGAQAVAAEMAASRYGWGADQFSCLQSLWTKESGWNYQAYNANGGATGIPQALPGNKMASAGADWQTNAVTQISWGLGYIDAVYGSPCSAWGHSQATDWY